MIDNTRTHLPPPTPPSRNFHTTAAIGLAPSLGACIWRVYVDAGGKSKACVWHGNSPSPNQSLARFTHLCSLSLSPLIPIHPSCPPLHNQSLNQRIPPHIGGAIYPPTTGEAAVTSAVSTRREWDSSLTVSSGLCYPPQNTHMPSSV